MTRGSTRDADRRRRSWLMLAGVAVSAAGVAGITADGSVAVTPALLAALAVMAAWYVWPRTDRLALIAGVAGAASLAFTVVIRSSGHRLAPGSTASSWQLAEIAALLLLITVVLRVSPAMPAGAGLAAASLDGAAVSVWIFRFGRSALSLSFAAGWALWTLVPVVAAGAGSYLRLLDETRTRSVLEARRNQRLTLAQDLHDYVAHDVSEMLAQAQAGHVLAAQSAPRLADLFERIANTGQAAMASLDRTVHMLHEDQQSAAVREPRPTLHDLPALCARFGACGTAVHLDVDPALDGDEDVPPETSGMAYRIIVEALSNVRRHAPEATCVEVSIRPAGDCLAVLVVNDAGAAGAGGRQRARRGGHGIAGLRERTAALGGSLEAGPQAPSGWRLAASLPWEGAR